jgi:putative addiction module component (TIGR02574 family)
VLFGPRLRVSRIDRVKLHGSRALEGTGVAPRSVLAYSQSMGPLTSDGIIRLSPPERLALISQLWDSLEEGDVALSAAQRAELDHRLSSFEQDLPEAVTWAGLEAELVQRCR